MNKIENVRIIRSRHLNENLLNNFYEYLKNENIKEVENVKEADLIISFGGDGTMLVSAQETLKNDIPIMAVNMGTLGYLAEISLDEIIEIFEKYKNGDSIIDERAFLEVKYNNETYFALNELALLKGGLISHLIEVEVYADDIFVNKYRADGVIVATPTGSTAYSLSAGGAIVHPNLHAVTITPLAPQSLNARPIIIDGNQNLKFRTYSRDNDVHLNIDGSECFRIKSTDKIEAVLSNKKIKIIRTGKNDYYSILREKLKWGDSIVK